MIPDSKSHTQQSILKSSLVTAAITFISRIFGLIREQVRAYYLGTGMGSDAFGLAATIPNLLRRLFAEGAMTAAFVPVFTEHLKEGDQKKTNIFLNRFFTLLSVILILVTAAGILASPWIINTFFSSRFREVEGKVELTIVLTQIMFPFLLLVSLAALVQAVLNCFKIFGPSAFSSVLMNISLIITAIAFAWIFPDPSYWPYGFAIGFIIGGIFQFLFQIPFLKGKGLKFRLDFNLRDKGVREVFKIFLPGIFSAGIYQINVSVSMFIAQQLAQGSIAALQYSLRLQELVLGIFAVSVATVILPAMSAHAAEKNFPALKSTLQYSINLLGFITIPASVGLILIAEPVVRLLFQYGEFNSESTQFTIFAMYFHVGGIFFIALNRNVVQVFYAMKDLKTPAIIAAIIMVIHIFLCFGLAMPLRHGGIALAGSAAAALNVIMLYYILRRRIGILGTRTTIRSLTKIIIASAIMGIFIAIVNFFIDSKLITSRLILLVFVFAIILFASLIYVAACKFMRCQELEEFVKLIRKKISKT